MPSFEMRCSSNISQESPGSRAIAEAWSASAAGGKSLPGVLLRSRAKHTLSAMICPVFAPLFDIGLFGCVKFDEGKCVEAFGIVIICFVIGEFVVSENRAFNGSLCGV